MHPNRIVQNDIVMQQQPRDWEHSNRAEDFFGRVKSAAAAVLMLDYDGTLAPFTEGRMDTRFYPGVRERLEKLLGLNQCRLVMISGRKAKELDSLLGLSHPIEIWGSHGREHIAPDKQYTMVPVTEFERLALGEVKDAVGERFDPGLMEVKPNSLAVHWRKEPSQRAGLQALMEELYRGLVQRKDAESTLQLLGFDGGVELRAGMTNKGNAVRKILAGMESAGCAAFLGDDTTDEDAFLSLRGAVDDSCAMPVLVKSEARLSYAKLWLRPPGELLEFLDCWIDAVASRAELVSPK